MSWHSQLRTYAMMDPTTLPDSVRLCHSDTSVTIHDTYPKGKYHALVLPRILPPLRAADVATLRALLMLPREQARAVLVGLRRDAQEAKALIEREMVLTHSFTWDVQIGFHALPSVEYVAPPLKHLTHLHLHIVSVDFLGESIKTKKHVNSFHPRMGFFLHIDEVIRWFDADIEPTYFAMKAGLEKKDYEPILKQDMQCPNCDAPHKTFPKLRKHLEAHWRTLKAEGIERELQKILAEQEAAGSPEPYVPTPEEAARYAAFWAQMQPEASAEGEAATEGATETTTAAAAEEGEHASADAEEDDSAARWAAYWSEAQAHASARAHAEGAEANAEADAASNASAAVVENGTSTDNGLKRKHGAGDEPAVVDVDALPDPGSPNQPPAKRQEVTAPGPA